MTKIRTISELVGEALRRYQRERRERITAKYRKRAEGRSLTEADVVGIIKDFRRAESKKRRAT